MTEERIWTEGPKIKPTHESDDGQALTQSKRLLLRANEARTLVVALRWLKVTCKTSSSGVTLGTNSNEIRNGAGYPISTDNDLEIMLSPGSHLYASGDDGSYIAYIVQPLPVPK